MRHALARRLRIWADRLDHAGAPKRGMLSFTFEHGRGMVVNEDGRGCPLWYYGDDDYERAHAEAVNPPPLRVDWAALSRP